MEFLDDIYIEFEGEQSARFLLFVQQKQLANSMRQLKEEAQRGQEEVKSWRPLQDNLRFNSTGPDLEPGETLRSKLETKLALYRLMNE